MQAKSSHFAIHFHELWHDKQLYLGKHNSFMLLHFKKGYIHIHAMIQSVQWTTRTLHVSLLCSRYMKLDFWQQTAASACVNHILSSVTENWRDFHCVWPKHFNNCICLVGQGPGGKRQPVDVRNADRHVKQVGAFAWVLQLAFRLQKFAWNGPWKPRQEVEV